ncbi:hypothetical protein CANTEDRAFT_97001 [Yamadazyma tenuis ATCC 10573]|uniref:P-loop containing nucleoside triphosphate hydrolase protein n=1 Tax=Candida tenuis (strain ATCC 10573 / BCRC 21748 / CBS 615 / JCM 9827 / NBRC 10315 / NRRL Y-1498 / VKM Y-70) TaxID=590646 RepID=G3AYT9_CANTC|nr:uncharacterized protein CANTEDRAFT_97001 [Yamadazyma tenuis ATCC 10573]EGV65927.1 hypothetical protein CANTEDRAFT_97001 [Yamadazyma tenuis ATCC 10573]
MDQIILVDGSAVGLGGSAPIPTGDQLCSIVSSWNQPLYSPYENSLNPCFISFVFGALNLFFIFPLTIQIINFLFFNTFGPYNIKYSFGSIFKVKSVGIFTLIRFNSVFIQCLLSLVLLSFKFVSFSDLKSSALILNVVTLVVFVLPLHLIEPTRCVIPATSLLFYWFSSSVINFVISLQDLFSEHKVYIPDGDISIQSAIRTVEILLLLNSVGIFILELFFYQPSVELIEYYDLNEWNYGRVRNIFNRVFFKFMKDTIDIAGKTNHVDVTNLPSIIIDLDNEVAYKKFLGAWNKSVSKTEAINAKNLEKSKKTGKPFVKKTPSLFWPLLSITKGLFFRALFFDYMEFFAQICQPYLYFSKSLGTNDVTPEPLIVGFGVATCLYLAAVTRYMTFNRKFVNIQGLGNVVETALSSHIYYKGMKLSPKERRNKTVGEIVNNMAQDISTVDYAPEVVIDVVSQPFRLVMYIYTLYNFLGASALAGLSTALVLIPIASTCYKFVYKEMNLEMKYKDERAKLMGEILNSIKSIKLYSWENPMLERLFEIRNNKELKVLRKVGILSTAIDFLWNSIPYGIAVSTFTAAAVFAGTELTPEVIFPSLTLFDLLTGPILALPGIFSNIAESKVSLARLIKFFTMEELEVDALERSYIPLRKGEEAVTIKNANFVWTIDNVEEKSAKDLAKDSARIDEEADIDAPSEVNTVALTDINFTAKKGELTCVVGRVGSGKSTLLKAILGCIPVDTTINTPTLKVNGSIAYCAQSAWILNSSVRENILFGRKYDKEFYQATVQACELSKDFEMLPDGDRTIVGEKGISLSGGQKARISLARAVYSKAEIYILDDVLSAVDTHVGKNIIKNVLGKDGLLASKTTILATNSVPVLHQAASIILLAEGKIIERGTFTEVMSTESSLAKLINEFGKFEEEEEANEETAEIESTKVVVSGNVSSSEDEHNPQQYQPIISEGEDLSLARVVTNATVAASFVSFGHAYDQDFDDDVDKVTRTGDSEEIKTKGKVNLMIYNKYIQACGYFSVVVYLALVVLSTALALSNTYVLKYWSEQNVKYGHNVDIAFYLTLYAAIGIISLLFTLVASFIIYAVIIINGSRYFHDTMAKSVLRSPMSFFETTPIGRILNRFTEDINVIDNQLIWALTLFANYGFRAVSVFAVVILNLPIMFFVLVFLLFFYDSFRRLFIPASRELKRLRSATKSPVFSHLQESITGVDTIFAYNQVDRFTHKASDNMNTSIKVSQANIHVNRWLSMRLQGLSAVVVYCSTLLILASVNSKNPLGPGLVGFIMTYVLDVTSTLNAIVRSYADIETRSITIERLWEYCNLKPEAEMVIEDNRPAESWPAEGAISFKNYETKYRENLDPVLNNISIDIKPREKIGIVGRTGAGKSTLTLAVFRIIEATGGHIEIDGVDTSKIGLFDLRSKLNIIPQDSQAIDGTVRQNLDPFGKHTDEELWKVLELSHLKEHIEGMKTERKVDDDEEDNSTPLIATGLNARIEEGGANLSAGQKQLMCLARALLNPSKVLILDEATASVDVQTDKIVQDTIRSEFNDKTILTIAHRIETIMDSDRILVLERGQVKEFDAPTELLKDQNTIFYSLCKQGGLV